MDDFTRSFSGADIEVIEAVIHRVDTMCYCQCERMLKKVTALRKKLKVAIKTKDITSCVD